MDIRFFHLADIHIGKCYSTHCLSPEHAESRRNETWGTFARICRTASEEGVDFLLIAGDLFDSHYCSVQDILGVSELFAGIAPIPVFVIAGNHDPLGDKSVYHWVKWPSNVHLFDAGQFKPIELADKNITIWGRSWDRKEDCDPVALPTPQEGRNILLHHGDLDREGSLYANLSSRSILEKQFTYTALGHIHRPEVFNQFPGAFAGSPEPLDFGEFGEHGYMDVRLGEGDPEISFVTASSRQFVALQVEASSSDTIVTLAGKVREQITGLNPQRDFFKIAIQGYWEGSFEHALQQLTHLLQPEFYDLTILDQTRPDINLERLMHTYRDSAIGMYISRIQEMELEEDLKRDALLFGIEALLKGKNG